MISQTLYVYTLYTMYTMYTSDVFRQTRANIGMFLLYLRHRGTVT